VLIIAPSHVVYDGVRINDVESIAIEHAAEQLVVEYTDTSRDPAFADVARRRTTVKLVCLLRKAPGQAPTDPAPGTLGELSFRIGPTRLATAPAAMVVAVSYQLAPLPKGAAARRTIEFLLTSPTGSAVLNTSTIGGVS
jgi:(2Fe-2S) ferredoxin